MTEEKFASRLVSGFYLATAVAQIALVTLLIWAGTGLPMWRSFVLSVLTGVLFWSPQIYLEKLWKQSLRIVASQAQTYDAIQIVRRDLMAFPEVRRDRLRRQDLETWGTFYSQKEETVEAELRLARGEHIVESQKEQLELGRAIRKDLMAFPEVRSDRVSRGSTEDWGGRYSQNPDTIDRDLRRSRGTFV